jgi:hypothetical protein
MPILLLELGLLGVVFGITAIILGKNRHMLLGVLLWWLIPPYPLGLITAQLIPKNEACGFGFICVGALIGTLIAAGWFALCPLIEVIYMLVKKPSRPALLFIISIVVVVIAIFIWSAATPSTTTRPIPMIGNEPTSTHTP